LWVPVPTLVGVEVGGEVRVEWGDPATSAQVPRLEKVPVPPVTEKVTLPKGSETVPPAVSLTVAVQVVDWLTAREASAQDTVVEVERVVTVMLNPVASEELAWIESVEA